MFWNQQRLALSTTLVLALACIGWVSAEDAKEAPAKSSSELVSPEFAEHLDEDAASIALREEDDSALLGIAEKLGAAERTAGKPNQKLPSARLFHAAIQAAYNKGDLKLLAQAEAAIKASKSLRDSEKLDFLKKIDLMKKGGAARRKIDPGPGLKANEVSAESVSLYNTFKNEIRTTQDYGAEEELDPLADGIKQLSEFHPKQREHLMKLIGEARSAIKERGEADPALAKLVAVSRGAPTGDFKILGPTSAPEGAIFVLTIIPNSANGAKAKQLELRGTRVPPIGVGGPIIASALLRIDPVKGDWSHSLSFDRKGPPIKVLAKVSGRQGASARFLAGADTNSLNSALVVRVLPPLPSKR